MSARKADCVGGYGYSPSELGASGDAVYVHLPDLCTIRMHGECEAAKECCFSELLRCQTGQREIYRAMGGKKHGPHYIWSWGDPPRDVCRLLAKWKKLRFKACRRVTYMFTAEARKPAPRK